MSLETFLADIRFQDLPISVKTILKRSVLDTIGVAAIGSQSEMSRITAEHGKMFWRSGEGAPTARLLFDGAPLSPIGAAMAGAFMVDSIDAHDGHSPVKGHAGSAIFPALIAFCDVRKEQGNPVSATEFLTAMAIGYEVGYRSGLTMHETVADYHTSGAWTAVGVAAMGAKLLGLSHEQTRHAMGIAEYHGPRSQMMRCIDHPTMLRDGVGWGAPSGVSAVFLAQSGFTGAPAITVEDAGAAQHWSDLGERWEIDRTHYKLYPVCRWAHPAVDAADELMKENKLESSDLESVRIQTFHNAIRLAGHNPQTLDEITYGIAFPTAMMIVRGQIGPAELDPDVLTDAEIRRISLATELVETEHYNRISVGERWADVTLMLKDGRSFQSLPRKPRGDPDTPLSDNEVTGKFHLFADRILGEDKANRIELLAGEIDHPDFSLASLLDLILAPID